MRFQFGKVPPDPHFDPQSGGWKKFREPNMALFWVYAIPLSVLMAAATFIVIGEVDDPSATIVIRPGDFDTANALGIILIGIVYFVGVLVLHEVVHLVAHPGFGLTNNSILGIWPKAGVCYAFYGGELSRSRFLYIIALPLLVLTAAPVFWFHLTGKIHMWLAPLALLNALGASFDVLVIGMVLRQVPWGATIRNNGWDTYWRKTEESNKRMESNG